MQTSTGGMETPVVRRSERGTDLWGCAEDEAAEEEAVEGDFCVGVSTNQGF